jgi:hypothetical protein
MKIPFFSGLFQKKTVKISLIDLEKELFEEEKKRFNAFEKKAFSVFAQINYLLKKINEECKKINEIETSKHGRIGKIVSSSKKDFVFQVESLTSKLFPPKNHSFEEIKKYSVNSNKLLQLELIKIHKLIAVTAFGLKEEMKELGMHFKELDSAFKELNKKLIESKLIDLIELKSKLIKLHELKSKSIELNSDEKKLLNELNSVKLLIEKEKENLSLIESSKEAKKLLELNKEIDFLEKQKNQLKINATALIGKADKPLKKLLKMIESKRFISQNYSAEDLNIWLSDSLKAMKLDQKGEKIKSAVKDCVLLINENNIDAKNEKEKNKWIQALTEINSTNFFEEFFWKLNSIKSKKNSFQEQINNIELTKKLKSKKELIFELQNKLTELKSKKQKISNLIEETNKSFSELKNLICFFYSEFTGKKIELN